jgi:hypothetical protein
MSCRRDLIDGTLCTAVRAESKVRRLTDPSGWVARRLHCECENGHAWHENLDDDLHFITDCDCEPPKDTILRKT